MRARTFPAEAGFSLIESIVTLAIMGILIAGTLSLYVYTRVKLTENEAVREMEGLRVQVQALLSQPELCNYVLRDIQNRPLSWSPDSTPTVSVPVLWYAPKGANPQVTLRTRQNYSRLITITNMYLREPVGYEGGVARSNLLIGAKSFRLISTKLILVGQASHGLAYQRAADVVLKIDDQQQISGCFSADNVSPVTTANGFNCTDKTVNGKRCSVADLYCPPIHYIEGFDAKGTPICSCMPSCLAGPQGESTGSQDVGDSSPKEGNNGSGDSTGGDGGGGGSGGGGGGGSGGE